MPFLVSPAASALADIGHLLESVENPPRQLARALELLGRFVPYDRCALLDACSTSVANVYVIPDAAADAHELLTTKLNNLLQLVSDTLAPQSGPLPLSEPPPGMARLAFPLIALDEAIGVLMVERSGEDYEAQHLQLLAVVAAQLGGYLANVRLQSEEKRATRAMHRAADLLEHIDDGFLELDTSLRCVSANRAALELLGLERAELLGLDLQHVDEIKAKKSFVEACENALRERALVRVEAEHYARKDRWLEVEVYPTELGVSVFLRDATERHAAEQFRDVLIGIIGHNLRTPLSAITMSAAALLRKGTLDAPATQSVARIASSGARMTEMVAQLLDMTRIRFGKGLRIERRDADLGQVCQEVVGELSAAHPTRDLGCAVSGNLRGHWDAARLSQVVSNLVANAIAHGAPGRPVRVDVRQRNGHATISVHNEGPPIPADLLSVIFQPFRQVDTKSPRKGKGLGLGLFIAQSIVRAHNGTIEVTSDAQAGTTFTVHLPLRV